MKYETIEYTYMCQYAVSKLGFIYMFSVICIAVFDCFTYAGQQQPGAANRLTGHFE